MIYTLKREMAKGDIRLTHYKGGRKFYALSYPRKTNTAVDLAFKRALHIVVRHEPEAFCQKQKQRSIRYNPKTIPIRRPT